jgi:predicted kinase
MLAQALRAEGLQAARTDPSDAAAQALWQQLTRWSGNRTAASCWSTSAWAARSPSSWPSGWRS